MAGRRTGDPNQFWSAKVLGAGETSPTVRIPHAIGTLALFLTSSGATTIKLQTVHPGELTSYGGEPNAPDSVWHDVYLFGAGQVQHVFSGAGSVALTIPDAALVHIRLHNLTAGVTVTAGWLGMPE
jgi:hypothetical protein